MTARVLVVDNILPNVKLLEAKLTGEYFDVLTATSGLEALDILHREQPDIILLDVMMPDMNGFEVCKRIKQDPDTMHIPVVMVTALDQQSDRIAGLQAGADDFLTKPVKDIALFARVKSLVRLKVTMDEIRNRESTEMSMGADEDEVVEVEIDPADSNVLLVEEKEGAAERISLHLGETAQVIHTTGGDLVAERAREKNYDLVVISLTMKDTDGLRIVSRLRSFEETRQVPILVMVDEDDTQILVRSLEMGVNDYLINPPEKFELMARVRTQLKRKKFADKLRKNRHLSMKLATTDAVTGLFNRHYMTTHLDTLIMAARENAKDLSVAMLDIDFFKKVNDNYGHAAGDEVLEEFGRRIEQNIRGVDLAARYGGEEFVVIMPDTSSVDAGHITERLRKIIQEEPFTILGFEDPIKITVSIGFVALNGDQVNSKILELADEALYKAKDSGRNKVVLAEVSEV